MSQFITTTPLMNMRPVGSAADRSQPRIEGILEKEFKGRLSLRLAEPVERTDRTGVDWYIDSDDAVTQLATVPQELADYYRRRLQTDVSVISSAAAGYESRSGQAAHNMASALRNAIQFPGDDNIWLLGDVPSGKAAIVLTAWGYERQTSELAGGRSDAIKRPVKVLPQSGEVRIGQGEPVPPPVDPSKPTPRNWLGILSSALWALAIVLPFAIGWFLLPACGIRVPFTDHYLYGWGDGAFCQQLPNPQMEAGTSQSDALTAELGALTQQVTAKIFQCATSTQAAAREPVQTDEDLIAGEGLDVDPDETSVSLTWHNTNDLDLYVVCPDGLRVPLEGNRCGAHHKLDMNRYDLTSSPVEYIRWEGAPRPGTYKIQVLYFQRNPPSEVATDFTVTLRRNGMKKEIAGTTSARVPGDNKETITITEFTVP